MYIETSQQETACEFSTHKASNDNGFISCRVAANGVIKVADFGLTEDMYQRKYFRQESNIRLPIKWMAIESIHDMVFSEKSDVVCIRVYVNVCNVGLLYFTDEVVIWSDMLGSVQSGTVTISCYGPNRSSGFS